MAKIKKLTGVVVLAFAAWVYYSQGGPGPSGLEPSANGSGPGINATLPVESADRLLADAFANRKSSVMAEGAGTVARLLSDDNQGDRHQRFVLRLGSGQTVLVAHNIDLADRIASIETGDAIAFKGEYEWNAEGGVLHWTHHDPAGRHPDGWLQHEGRIYQ